MLTARFTKFGFTLIELLVVISIVGILTTLVVSNLVGVRERARDAQRKSDVAQIQRALEMYKGTQTPPAYPASLSSLTTGTNPAMKVVPNDPNCPNGTCTGSWPNYINASMYKRDPSSVSDNLTYKVTACLENKSDAQKDANQSVCPGVCKDPNGDADTADGGVCFTRTEP